ncbi:hypothetical protein SELMODRAFT_430936 [Selaginella moellendorffii]|uniref:RING-type domain-containing protein n=1 Tax=Selaginella moellendorffii TaxID=88036 RepID=D8TB05_SELML|nr:hypothetical protein SELMODRAFT_430936 [Selaginella moellendorffii]
MPRSSNCYFDYGKACDHPFLVLSRGDTEDFADLGKLARRFLDKNSSQVPSTAYVKEVVDDIRKGESAECPICLEMHAVLTPCAHRMCRECLLNSWRTSAGGPCPISEELITVPRSNPKSSKVEALLHHLQTLSEAGSKSVDFSQWTAFLDLLEIPLKSHLPSRECGRSSIGQTKNVSIKRFIVKDRSEEAAIDRGGSHRRRGAKRSNRGAQNAI